MAATDSCRKSRQRGKADWLPVTSSPDPSDPKLAHLDGLNLSRAWMLEGILAGFAYGRSATAGAGCRGGSQSTSRPGGGYRRTLRGWTLARQFRGLSDDAPRPSCRRPEVAEPESQPRVGPGLRGLRGRILRAIDVQNHDFALPWRLPFSILPIPPRLILCFRSARRERHAIFVSVSRLFGALSLLCLTSTINLRAASFLFDAAHAQTSRQRRLGNRRRFGRATFPDTGSIDRDCVDYRNVLERRPFLRGESNWSSAVTTSKPCLPDQPLRI